MKKATKQEFIHLLEKVFSDADFDLGELQGHLSEKLSKYIKQTSPYLKALRNLESDLHQHLETDNPHYADPDFIYQLIKNTLDILNTPLRQLEEQEAARQKQLELEQYHKELPLRLLELLAETESLGLNYKVCKTESSVKAIVYEPYYNEEGRYMRWDIDIEIHLDGEFNEYYEIKNAIERLKDEKLKEQQKAALIAAAKAKLTDEERKLLGL